VRSGDAAAVSLGRPSPPGPGAEGRAGLDGAEFGRPSVDGGDAVEAGVADAEGGGELPADVAGALAAADGDVEEPRPGGDAVARLGETLGKPESSGAVRATSGWPSYIADFPEAPATAVATMVRATTGTRPIKVIVRAELESVMRPPGLHDGSK
jgi:hypothetical protein